MSIHLRWWEGYTLHVHTAGGVEEYTLHVRSKYHNVGMPENSESGIGIFSLS
jgi:hypothetical protein